MKQLDKGRKERKPTKHDQNVEYDVDDSGNMRCREKCGEMSSKNHSFAILIQTQTSSVPESNIERRVGDIASEGQQSANHGSHVAECRTEKQFEKIQCQRQDRAARKLFPIQKMTRENERTYRKK